MASIIRRNTQSLIDSMFSLKEPCQKDNIRFKPNILLHLFSCCMLPFFVVLLVLLGGFSSSFAQEVPVVRLSVPYQNLYNGAFRLDDKNIILRERPVTIMRASAALQSATIIMNRTLPSARTEVLYTFEYFQTNARSESTPYYSVDRLQLSALPNKGGLVRNLPSLPYGPCGGPVITPPFASPSPISINGLEGDLSPELSISQRPSSRLTVATISNPGKLIFDAGITTATISIRARYSDQEYQRNMRNAGRQGIRLAVFKLLPSNTMPLSYQVSRGSDSVYIYLFDPEDMTPTITNQIPDIVVEQPKGNSIATGAIELENECWTRNNSPGSVFYDDNYDQMTYTVTSEQPNFATVRISNSSPGTVATPGIPLLIYRVFPNTPIGTSIPIKVTANDEQSDRSYNQSQCTFNIKVVSSIPTSIADRQDDSPTISIAPNPTREIITVQGTALKTGIMNLNIVNVLGQNLINKQIQVIAGTTYNEKMSLVQFPAGVYVVEVESGGAKEIKTIVKE
jgi:hypothetical protein